MKSAVWNRVKYFNNLLFVFITTKLDSLAMHSLIASQIYYNQSIMTKLTIKIKQNYEITPRYRW